MRCVIAFASHRSPVQRDARSAEDQTTLSRKARAIVDGQVFRVGVRRNHWIEPGLVERARTTLDTYDQTSQVRVPPRCPGRARQRTVDDVPFIQEQLSQVRTILPGNTSEQCHRHSKRVRQPKHTQRRERKREREVVSVGVAKRLINRAPNRVLMSRIEGADEPPAALKVGPVKPQRAAPKRGLMMRPSTGVRGLMT